MPRPTIHTHPPTSPLLQTALKSSLPYSINLVYRTKHPYRTPNAHILATFPPADADAASTTIPKCWAAAYLDRSMRPETELWIFASGEMPGHSTPPFSSSSSTSSCDEEGFFCRTCREAVLALMDYMSELPAPPMLESNLPALDIAREHEKRYPESGPGVRYPAELGAYMRHLLLPSVVTLGACHHEIVRICQEVGLVREEFPGPGDELNKFLFTVGNLPQTRALPEGLRWGTMGEKDAEIVKTRTNIPRTTRTLLAMKSLGVFEESTGKPIAWAFLGLDGSLTTLHTEPEYRGKGIAKAVAAKLFREFAPELAVDEKGVAWAHADVYIGNTQSESVCRSLGGNPMWRHFWVRIDLAQGGSLVTDDASEV
ncbi:uncharacterized protein EI97DRAFT_465565 [Westerdykella ornata]|uniref:GCN5-related N-acetyltransferase Rv2170-like domain-containing protein n=1 Tax=Westerdykella ornata TaxID=318751 RepID=A0A6A6JNK7_WESOR|nr:uncharacterized protein EI97DRAFT_465565 [Westerdykella ornata]KAF2278210.1 hypothetical protein EI97DRAFT_465565 [Westerdykella ornata]